jgi:hypothetical protein
MRLFVCSGTECEAEELLRAAETVLRVGDPFRHGAQRQGLHVRISFILERFHNGGSPSFALVVMLSSLVTFNHRILVQVDYPCFM